MILISYLIFSLVYADEVAPPSFEAFDDLQVVSHEGACLPRERLRTLRESIFCQQMANPAACDEFKSFFSGGDVDIAALEATAMGATDGLNPVATETISDEELIQRVTNAGALGAVLGAQRAAGTLSPRVRAFIATRAISERIGSIQQTAAAAGRALTPAEQSRIGRLLTEMRNVGGRFFPFLRNLPAQIPGAMVARAVAATAGRLAARGVATVLSGPVGAGLLVAEVIAIGGRAAGRAYERRIECTADRREGYAFMCVTERCANHYTVCQNQLAFAFMDIEAQEDALANYPELCSYMQGLSEVTEVDFSQVSLQACPVEGQESSNATINFENFTFPDITPVRADGSTLGVREWTPPANDPQNVQFKLYMEDGQLQSSYVHMITEQPAGMDPSLGTTFTYDENGDMTHLQGVLISSLVPEDQIHRYYEATGVNPVRNMSPRITREQLIPPENVGFMALRRYNHEMNYSHDQAFLFQGRLAEIYHEARVCCEPRAGESCRLRRVSPPTGPIEGPLGLDDGEKVDAEN